MVVKPRGARGPPVSRGASSGSGLSARNVAALSFACFLPAPRSLVYVDVVSDAREGRVRVVPCPVLFPTHV